MPIINNDLSTLSDLSRENQLSELTELLETTKSQLIENTSMQQINRYQNLLLIYNLIYVDQFKAYFIQEIYDRWSVDMFINKGLADFKADILNHVRTSMAQLTYLIRQIQGDNQKLIDQVEHYNNEDQMVKLIDKYVTLMKSVSRTNNCIKFKDALIRYPINWVYQHPKHYLPFLSKVYRKDYISRPRKKAQNPWDLNAYQIWHSIIVFDTLISDIKSELIQQYQAKLKIKSKFNLATMEFIIDQHLLNPSQLYLCLQQFYTKAWGSKLFLLEINDDKHPYVYIRPWYSVYGIGMHKLTDTEIKQVIHKQLKRI